MVNKLLLAMAVFCASAMALASGMPDATFGENGALILDLDRQSPEDQESANDVIVDAQGRYVVAGQQRCKQPCGIGGAPTTGFLARYLRSGAVDPTFNAGHAVFFDSAAALGLASGDVYPYKVLEQTDGRLLVGGRWRNTAFVCRFLSDGTVDVQFAQSGCREFEDIEGASGLEYYSDIALQDNGRILVLAQAAYDPDDLRSYALVRLTSEGKLDTSFGNAECPHCGVVLSPPGLGYALCCRPMALALDPHDGRIVVAGSVHSAPLHGLTAVRIKSSGEFDQGLNILDFSSFVGGEALHRLLGVQVLSDSSVHVLGTAHGAAVEIAVGKVLGNGTPDPMFGNQGRVALSYPDDDYNDAQALGIQSDGKFLFAGEDDGCVVMRVDGKDGSIDGHFGIAGRTDFLQTTDTLNNCRPFAIAADGKHILVAGRVILAPGYDHENALLFRLEQDVLFGDGLEG